MHDANLPKDFEQTLTFPMNSELFNRTLTGDGVLKWESSINIFTLTQVPHKMHKHDSCSAVAAGNNIRKSGPDNSFVFFVTN